MQRPRAVVADPDGDALVVEHLADVVGVHPLDVEGDRADPVGGVGRADDPHPRPLRQAGEQPLGEGVLVGRDAVHAQLAEVVDGGTQAHRLGGVGRARLEPLRRRGVGRRLHPDGLDHRAAGDERRHRVQQLAAAPEDADAGGAEHLVAGERREVDARGRPRRARRCGADWQASSTVSAPTARAASVSSADRVDGAEHVGDVGEREDLGALGQQLAERRAVLAVQVEPTLVGDADPAQRGAGAPRQLLPRHEVGVVLHLGDEDLVALAAGRAGGPWPARPPSCENA